MTASAPISLEGRLAQAAAAGDARAFRLLYERHAGAVHRFARGLARDAATADEITQESFVRAHQALARLSQPERVLPWLLGIARLVAFEQLRARGEWRPLDEAATDALPARALGPEALLLAAEAERAYALALAALGEERRAALLLATDHGLAYADIGQAMGWTLAKTKIEIHRARAELRARLGEYLEPTR